MSVEYIENWFSPFIFKWLQQLSKKTVSWVDNAILADDFQPVAGSKNGILSHSSSVSDIFSALFSNLQLFDSLGFATSTKVERVYQSFAQVNLLLTDNEYDVGIVLREVNDVGKGFSSWINGFICPDIFKQQRF